MSSSGIRTIWPKVIAERTTPRLRLDIVDEAGDPITSLSTLTLTLHDGAGVIINSRDRVNVLSDFAAGTLTWQFEAADTQVLYPTRDFERHTALIEWSWDSGTRHGKHEVIHTVRNLATVPAA